MHNGLRLRDIFIEQARVSGGVREPHRVTASLNSEIFRLNSLVHSCREARADDLADAIGKMYMCIVELAAMYSADLPACYSNVSDGESDTTDAFGSLDQIRQLATVLESTLSHYARPNFGLGPAAAIESVESILKRLQRAVRRMVAAVGIAPSAYMARSLHHIKSSPNFGDLQSWHPCLAESLLNFSAVRHQTPCIFASRARLWGSPGIAAGESFSEQAIRSVSFFIRFANICCLEGLDGYVVELTNKRPSDDLSYLEAGLNKILRIFAQHDFDGLGCFKFPVETEEWRFRFAEKIFFVSVFSPFYSSRHPRRVSGGCSDFILLQPDSSFDRHGVHRRNPRRDTIKAAVRTAFERRGMGYDYALVAQKIEAYKFIKPGKRCQPLVRWWEFSSPETQGFDFRSCTVHDDADILAFQRLTHEVIGRLGGYWRPLSAVARVIEEIGEVVDAYESDRTEAEPSFSKELADLFIITTCIANQFNVNLSAQSRHPFCEVIMGDATVEVLLLKVVSLSADMARTINHYDGDKVRKANETVVPVAVSTGRMVNALGQLARVARISLIECSWEVLAASVVRDRGRFNPPEDPSMAPALAAFLQQPALARYGMFGGLRLWGNPVVMTATPSAPALALSKGTLRRFRRIGALEGLHGYLFAFTSDVRDGAILDSLQSLLGHRPDLVEVHDLECLPDLLVRREQKMCAQINALIIRAGSQSCAAGEDPFLFVVLLTEEN